MEILLRDAPALDRACQEAAETIKQKFETEPNIPFSAHVMDGQNLQEIEARLLAGSRELLQDIDDVLELYMTQSKLRIIIGQANAPRVNPLETERKISLEPAKKLLKSHLEQRNSLFGSRTTRHDAVEVAARLKGIRQRMATVTTDAVSDSVSVATLSEAQREMLRDRLADIEQRMREVGNDKARENVNIRLTLPDEIVTVLRKHKIVR